MVNEIAAADAVHPLAQAGVELPKPKEPIVADAEGIKGMDSAQQPTLCLRRLRLQKCLLDVVLRPRIPGSSLSRRSRFLVWMAEGNQILDLESDGPSVDGQSPAIPVDTSDIKAAPCSRR